MNLFSNAGFEEDFNGWSIFSIGESGTPLIDTVTRHSGNKSCHLINTGKGGGSLISGSLIPVSPGIKVRFSAWGKGVNIIQGAEPYHKLYAAGRFVAEDQKTYLGQMDLAWQTGTFDWAQQQTVMTVPKGAKYFKIAWAGLGWTASGEAWLDDFSFEEVINWNPYIGAGIGAMVGIPAYFIAKKNKAKIAIGATVVGAIIGAIIGYMIPKK